MKLYTAAYNQLTFASRPTWQPTKQLPETKNYFASATVLVSRV
jgi:hypothetical protein